MPNLLLEAALEYEARGWSVFPVTPLKKRPPLVNWSLYHDKRASREQITKWWTDYPTANIGVVTGRISGIVVIDVDTKHGADVSPVLDANPTELVARTTSGGYHLFYRYPDGAGHVPNRTGIIKGVDIKSDGGYVVVAPSPMADGSCYSWEQEGDVANLPEETLKLILVTETRGPQANLNGDHWLSGLLEHGAPDGQWNSSVAKLAGYMAKKGVPPDVAAGLLTSWNHAKNAPPHTDDVLARTVESVYKTADRRSGPFQAIQLLDDDADPTEKPRGLFDVMRLGSYMSAHGGSEVKWAVQDWLPEGTIGFLVSPPGSFKTWMLLDLAVSVASGTPFLGQFPVKQGPVIIAQQEDHHGGMADRIGVIMESRFNMLGKNADPDSFDIPIPPDLPLFLHPDRNLRFSDDAVMDELERQVAEIKPSLVIIDPLYSAASTDDYMAKSAEQMFRLKNLRDRYGCGFLLAHHTKKGANESTAREGLWGSQFLNAFLETGWQVRRTEGEQSVVLRRHFKVCEDKQELTLTFDINTFYPYRYKVQVGESTPELVMDLVGMIAKNGPMDVKAMAEMVGKHRSTVSRRAKALERDNMLKKEADGKYNILVAPEF